MAKFMTHRMSKTKIYKVWVGMKTRCTNENFARYKDYGGRGITYDKAWEQFENFYKDMGETYLEGLSLDRINNDGNYCKDNCRWTDIKTQNQNRRPHFAKYKLSKNRRKSTKYLIQYDGIEYSIKEFSEKFKIPYSTVKRRIFNYGLSPEEVLKLPKGKGHTNGINKNK